MKVRICRKELETKKIETLLQPIKNNHFIVPVYWYTFLKWCQTYSLGLTRAKRAFFDEFNVLETYQPRARTMGHLFVPEPPTPVPDAQRHQHDDTVKETERSVFLQMRDAHYENEYTYLEKLNRELREGGNVAKQPQNEVQNGMSNRPKIEGPVLIEFHADSETDDDDYSL
uniref:Uncharacterized protein n=1 Tax=Loa loa TaxID=7209 RepID=A0A1I7VUD4_LOALO